MLFCLAAGFQADYGLSLIFPLDNRKIAYNT